MCFCEAAWQGVEVFSCQIGWLGAAVVHRVVKLLGGIGQLVPSCSAVIARVLAVSWPGAMNMLCFCQAAWQGLCFVVVKLLGV